MKFICFLDMDGVIVDLPSNGQHDPIEEHPEFQDPLFWECLKKTPWADELVDLCCKNFQTFILTKPCGPASIIGKLAWIDRWHNRFAENMIFTHQKELLAGSGRILIDDSSKNCTLFSGAGGTSILVGPHSNYPNFPMDRIFKRTRELGELARLLA